MIVDVHPYLKALVEVVDQGAAGLEDLGLAVELEVDGGEEQEEAG